MLTTTLLCYVQRRLRSSWWGMRCWPRSKGTSPLNRWVLEHTSVKTRVYTVGRLTCVELVEITVTFLASSWFFDFFLMQSFLQLKGGCWWVTTQIAALKIKLLTFTLETSLNSLCYSFFQVPWFNCEIWNERLCFHPRPSEAHHHQKLTLVLHTNYNAKTIALNSLSAFAFVFKAV